MSITLPPDLTGQTFGVYRVVPPRIEGGMAVVYRASQPIGRTTRDVAIKIIDSSPAQLPDVITQFEREVELLAKVDHPHIVKLYADGQQGQYRYLVMALLNGGSLSDLLFRSGKLPAETVRIVLDQVGSALDSLHRVRYVHCDLKPANVLLNQSGDLFLTDFGIAEPMGGAGGQIDSPGSGSPRGTPEYAAPEQWRGEPINARTDIYALGVMLFELLIGQPPFISSASDRSGRIRDLKVQHLTMPPAVMLDKQPALAPGVKTVLDKALSKSPADRYPSAAALRDAYERAIGVIPGETRLTPVIVVAAPPPMNAASYRSMPTTGSINPSTTPLTQPSSPAMMAPSTANANKKMSPPLRPLLNRPRLSLTNPLLVVAGVITVLVLGGLISTQIIAPILNGDVPPYIDASPLPVTLPIAMPSAILSPPRPTAIPTSISGVTPTNHTITTTNARKAYVIDSVIFASGITRVNFSSDGKTLLSADANAIVKRWTVANDSLSFVQQLDIVYNAGGPLILFNADGTRILRNRVKDPNILLYTWDMTIQHYNEQQVSNPITALAFAAGAMFAAGDSAGNVVVWSLSHATNTATGIQLLSETCGTDPISAIAFSPDGQNLVVVGQNGILCGWNISDPTNPKSNLFKSVGAIRLAAFSPNGRVLVLGSTDGTVQLIKATDGSALGILPSRGGDLTDMAFSPDGGLLAVATSVDTLTIWDLGTYQPLTVQLSGQGGSSVAWSPNGKLIATGSPDGTLRLWGVP